MSIDIVVSYDTTGSMRPCIVETRRKVSEFVRAVFDEYTDLRVGIITHGDYCDDPKVTTEFQLSDKRDDIVRFVNDAPNTSGGDSDECYEYVMERALSFDWREDSQKIFVLLGDADPHEVGYRYGSFRVTKDWRNLANEFKNRSITFYPVQCLYGRSHFYQTLAKINDTPKLSLAQFSDILLLLSALIHKAQSNDRLEVYEKQLESEGKLNRNLAQIIDQLLGKASKEYDFEPYTLPTARSYKPLPTRSKFTLPDGLVPVEPSRFQMLHVDAGTDIKSFVQSTGARFQKGKGFYELTKTEEVQESKEVVLRHKKSGDMFTGKEARQLINLPYGSRGKVKPDRTFEYDVFVQSTSVNRKLMPDTRFLYEVEMY